MSAPQALAGFLRRTHQRFPRSTLVLSLEGHGGAFVPEIDFNGITAHSVSNYTQDGKPGKVQWVQSEQGTSYVVEAGSPALPMADPVLPMADPVLPAARIPMSTWALGQALQSAIQAGVQRPAIIHFNNCFNASLELLHTVAPFADYATGYANYDFFTAGAAYPGLFHQLKTSPAPVSRADFARWLALANQAELAQQAGHPTVGASVALAGVRKLISPRLDDLSNALVKALQANRADARQRIREAAKLAQHYDTVPGYELQVPDQFMDIASFAAAVQKTFDAADVRSAGAGLEAALAGQKVYGDVGSPSMAGNPAVVYDFSDKRLGLNIFFPDPDLSGRWDWRSPYYLSGVPYNPAQPVPPPQRHVIDFLADPAAGVKQPWVNLIKEYHRDVPFVAFYAVQPFFFPLANPRGRNPGGPTGPNGPAGPTKTPGTTTPRVRAPRKPRG
jgi:hypothetical protein